MYIDFNSYLSKRTQKVKVQNTHSNTRIVECGVSQGTVLRPILLYCCTLITKYVR